MPLSRHTATAATATDDAETLRESLLAAIDALPPLAVAPPVPVKGVAPFPDDVVPILHLIEALVALNPSSAPTAGWGTMSNAPGPLNGVWKLRFTTAADGRAPPGRRGSPTLTQMVNTTMGSVTDVVEFKQHTGKVKGYRIVYKGPAVSPTGLQLACARFVVDRRSRWKLNAVRVPFAGFVVPRFVRKNVARPVVDDRFPSLRAAAATAAAAAAAAGRGNDAHLCLETVYLDDEVKIHVTGDGNLHVHSRLYDVWDPMIGWTMVSAV